MNIAGIAGWLFALWHVTGAPAVTLIAANYLAYAFPLSRLSIHLIAAAIILIPCAINLRGIVVSNRIQLAVVVSIVALLVLAVAFSLPSIRLENYRPFLPNGVLPVGTAAALIFWSYLGYENVSNVAEEFRNPERDFLRSVIWSVVITGLLYCSVAFVTVGSLAYASGGSVAPFAAMFSHVLGRYGAAGTAILAVAIVFSAINAYTAGMSRVVLAAARDGAMPHVFSRVSTAGVPSGSLLLLTGLALVMLAVFYLFDVDLKTALLIPSGAAILVYVIGSAAGIKLLGGRGIKRALPWISLAISVAVLPFVGPLAFVGVGVGAASILYGLVFRRR